MLPDLDSLRTARAPAGRTTARRDLRMSEDETPEREAGDEERPEDLLPLVERAAAGDQRSIDSLIVEYTSFARATARRLLGAVVRSREESIDIVQSVCREALRERERFEFQGEGPFRGWLQLLIERKITDRHRQLYAAKRAIDRERPLGGDSADAVSPPVPARSDPPPAAAERRERDERLKSALEELPAELSEAVWMHEADGASYPEIAERLGCTLKQARYRVYKGKVELARRLAEEQ